LDDYSKTGEWPMLENIEINPRTFLRNHCSLPALPEVVGKIQSIIHEDNVNIEAVADLISGDPAVLAQVLKVVNSAYYGLPEEITKVRMAIAYLGLNEVYRIVLCLSVVNSLAIKNKKELDAFWFHSFYTAVCAKYIAKAYEPHLSLEELWPAAMLHDIGKLVYLKFFPKHYKALTAYKNEHGCLFNEAEKEKSLPESSYLGTLLCDHWRLPTQVRDACDSHTLEHLHDIQGDDRISQFKRFICLGNLIAVLSNDELNNNTKQEIAADVKAKLDCDDSKFLTIMGDIYELKIEAENFTEKLG
jgi:HD-like signal output (HDOD) protein